MNPVPSTREPEVSQATQAMQSAPVRRIDSLRTFVVATIVLGPFALPLLWRNPRFGWKPKVAGTAAVVLLTYALVWLMETYSKPFLRWYGQLLGVDPLVLKALGVDAP